MAADVTLRFQGQVGNTQQVITALEKRVEKLGNKLEIASKKGRKGARSMRADMAKAGAQFVKTALLAGGITAVLTGAASAARGLRLEAERTALALDKSARKLQIQAGLTDLQSEKAQERTSAISKRTGFGQEAVNRVSTELVSQGFDRPLQTGTTQAVIAGLQAFNRGEEAEIEALITGIGQTLFAQKKAFSAKNVLKLLTTQRGLFKKTPLQLEDLSEFAKVAGLASSLEISPEDFRSASAIAKKGQVGGEASTGFSNLLTKLSTKDAGVRNSLKKFGIDLEDVDLSGETLEEVLLILGKKFKELPQEEKAPFLAGIVGKRKVNLQTLQNLISGAEAGSFKQFAKFQKDPKGFEQGVRVSREGISASTAKIDAILKEEQRKAVLGGGVTESEAEKFFKLTAQREIEGLTGPERFFKSIGQAAGRKVGETVGFRNILEPQEEKFILQQRKSNFSLKSLESKTNRNVPERVGKLADPAIDALKAIDRKRAEKPRAVESPLQQPGLPTSSSSPAAGPAQDLANQKTQGEILQALEEQNELLRQNGNGNDNRKVIKRNAHR